MQSGRRQFLGAALGAPMLALGGCLTHGPSGNPLSAAADESAGLRLWRGFIQPAVQRFHQDAHALHQALTAHAAMTAVWRDGRVNEAFHRLVRAWAGLSLLRFGPLVQDNRFERLFFWPDPRNVMQRQIRPLLQSVDTVPQDLRAHSVAVQGLPALEYVMDLNWGLLPEDRIEAQYEARGAYVRALARNLLAIAQDLQQAWGDVDVQGSYAWDFAHPGPSNTFYRNEKEVLAEAIKVLSAGLRFAGEVQLRAALGLEQSRARVQRLPFWRKHIAGRMLALSVRALAQWHFVVAFAGEPGWLRQNLQGELQQSTELLYQSGISFSDMAASPDTWQTLSLVVLKLDNARRMVDEDLAAALGVALGFNALDGD